MVHANNIRTKERSQKTVLNGRMKTAAKTCNVLLSLICLSGLFLGLFFPVSALCNAVAGREIILGNTLFGLILERLQGSLSAPPAQIMPVLLYHLPVILAAAIVLSLLFTVLSLIFPKTAPNLLYWNVLFVLLGYAIASVLVFANGNEVSDALPFDTLIPLALGLLLYAIYLLIKRRNAGGILLLLFSLCALFSVVIPQSFFKQSLFRALEKPFPLENTLCIFLLAGFSVFNALLTLVRIGSKRGYLLEIVLFSLHCLSLAAYIAVTAITAQSFAFITAEPFVFAAVALFPIAALITAIVLFGRERAKKH